MSTQTATFAQRVQFVRQTFAQRVQFVRQTVAGTTPAMLRSFEFGTWALVLLSYAFLFWAFNRYEELIQVVRKDATASMVAAQQIQAGLADTHDNATKALLTPDDKGFEEQYITQRDLVGVQIVKASQNITYPGEESEITKIQTIFHEYTDLIKAAFLYHQLAADPQTPAELKQLYQQRALRLYWQADVLFHAWKRLLPAAEELHKINEELLKARYGSDRTQSRWILVGGVLTVVLLLLLLGANQFFLFRRMHRILNPALLVATMVVLGLLVYTLSAFLTASGAIRLAKEDAFDSEDVLWKARADGYDAMGCLSSWLLDKDHRAFYEKEFKTKARAVVQVPEGMTYDQLVKAIEDHKKPAKFDRNSGALAVELNNITFRGEDKAAQEALKAWGSCLAISEQIRQLEKEGKHDAAVQLCVGKDKDQASGALAGFDVAVRRTLKINEDQFELAIGTGGDNPGRAGSFLKPFAWITAAALLIVCLLTFLGLRPRLREYTF